MNISHKLFKMYQKMIRLVFNYLPNQRLANAYNVMDIRKCAQQRAHKMVFDYIDS